MIDFIATSPEGEATLILVDDQPWDGTTDRVVALQDRLNGAAAYLLDGGFAADHPDLAKASARIELRCVHAPDAVATHFLTAFRSVLQDRGVPFSVKQIRRPAH